MAILRGLNDRATVREEVDVGDLLVESNLRPECSEAISESIDDAFVSEPNRSPNLARSMGSQNVRKAFAPERRVSQSTAVMSSSPRSEAQRP